jgi:hypothetical protein
MAIQTTKKTTSRAAAPGRTLTPKVTYAETEARVSQLDALLKLLEPAVQRLGRYDFVSKAPRPAGTTLVMSGEQRQIYFRRMFPKWQPVPEIVAGVNSENRASVTYCFRSLKLVCTLTPSCYESGGANGLV